MIVQNCDGTLSWNHGSDSDTSGRSKLLLGMPVNLGAEQSELFERLATFTLDILGISTDDLRTHTAENYGAGFLASTSTF